MIEATSINGACESEQPELLNTGPTLQVINSQSNSSTRAKRERVKLLFQLGNMTLSQRGMNYLLYLKNTFYIPLPFWIAMCHQQYTDNVLTSNKKDEWVQFRAIISFFPCAGLSIFRFNQSSLFSNCSFQHSSNYHLHFHSTWKVNNISKWVKPLNNDFE